MSVFHRVDDIDDLPGPKFFRFACRLTAYTGVLQARVEALREEEENGGSPSTSTTTGTSGTSRYASQAASNKAIPEDSPEMLNAIHAHAGRGANLFKVVKVPRKEDDDNV